MRCNFQIQTIVDSEYKGSDVGTYQEIRSVSEEKQTLEVFTVMGTAEILNLSIVLQHCTYILSSNGFFIYRIRKSLTTKVHIG